MAATRGHTAVRLAPLSLVTIVTDPIHPCASWVRCLKTRRGETALQVEGGRASADRRTAGTYPTVFVRHWGWHDIFQSSNLGSCEQSCDPGYCS
ncbi:hypothetical protein AGOR_G00238390 [Albula goreensis]|uniref:Uncharacterized protein n=1 Tax=Albula goreensis TaxID=1534307 RepID=A0A8T3CI80_9TELE|nr:hypothetical protein AGOR_G00238390 [Albula goreensis]